MGWWETGSGEILGDGPADVLIDTLQKLPAPPTFEDVLNAAAVALAEVGSEVLREPSSPASFGLCATFKAPAPTLRSGDPVDRQLVQALRSFLLDTGEDYQFAVKRRPTIREILRTMVFCLRGEGEQYLTGSTARDLLDIQVEGIELKEFRVEP